MVKNRLPNTVFSSSPHGSERCYTEVSAVDEKNDENGMLTSIFSLKIQGVFIFSFLLVFSVVYNSFAQTDSLLSEFRNTPKDEEQILKLIDLTQNIADFNVDSALVCVDLIHKIDINPTKYELQGKVWVSMGAINMLSGKYHEANIYFNEALKIAENNQLIPLEISCLYNIGELNRCIGLLNESLQFLYLAKNLTLKHKVNHQYPKIYDRLSASYFQLAVHDDHRFEDMKIPNQNDLGIGKKTPQDFIKLCKVYADSALILSKANNDIRTNLSSLNLLGAYYRFIKQLDNANTYFFQALDLSNKQGFQTNAPNYYSNISKNYYDQENYRQAIKYGLEGFKIADELNIVAYKSMLSHNLRISYEKIKDFENAFNFHIIETETREFIYDQQNWNQISELNKKYQSEKKQQEIEYQQKLLEIKKSQVFRLNMIIAILFVVMLIIFIGAAFIQKQKKRIKTQADKIAEQYKRLEKLDQFKESLTHALVHDLKNPLSQVLMNTSNRNVRNAAGKMLRLVSNMLDVEKYETAEFRLNKEQHSLRNILEEVINGQEISIKEKNLELHLHFTDYKIMTDKEVMIRVFDNLLSNAIRYSPLNRSIDVKVEPSGDDMLQISISNYGDPILDEALPYIFDKYRHFGKTNGGALHSTGLGLTFCKMAVEAHKGKIDVKSERNKGTTFCFTLQATNNEPIQEFERPVLVRMPEKFSLNTGEKEILAPYIVQFEKTEIYKILELRKILRQITTDNVTIQKWKVEIRNAIESGNQERYDELLNS